MTTVHPVEPHGPTPTVVPALPYAGTEGYSGSDTSEERARAEAADGTAASRQAQVRRMLRARGAEGMTVKEFREATGHHHGKASGTLSSMHKDGDVVRLAERRNRCEVYVLPAYVNGRETRSQGREKPVSEVDAFLQEWLTRDPSAHRDNPAAWSKAGNDPLGFIRGLRALTGYGA